MKERYRAQSLLLTWFLPRSATQWESRQIRKGSSNELTEATSRYAMVNKICILLDGRLVVKSFFPSLWLRGVLGKSQTPNDMNHVGQI